jgi:OmcA/MtrC family decaheme c-type cytochrome
VRVAYTTQNYTSPQSGSNPGQPIQIDYLATPAVTPNADGSYTKTAAVALPSGLIGGSGVVFLEGRVIAEYEGELVETGVKSSDPLYFAITDTTPQARRGIVDIRKCDDCHKQLSAHGDNRNDQTELCAVCHNPELAEFDADEGDTVGRPFDFKVMVHAIHRGRNLGDLDFEEEFAGTYPGKINNCEGCHVPGGYYPVDPTEVFATSVNPGADDSTPVDDTAWTPNAAVCYSCHTTDLARLHIEQQGGSFDATKNADGSSNEAALENCGFCHGEGRNADVKVEHGVGEFKFN